MAKTGKPLNLFYGEPDPDRWLPYDRYPRRFIRRIVRGKARPGGVMTIVINLMKGLDKLGVPYRLNDYRYIRKHPEEIACIIGKPHVLFDRKWRNPVILGAGIYSHPIDFPDLFERYTNVKRLLVPGEWMKQMCELYYGDKVLAWPTGIDTDTWIPDTGNHGEVEFLIYDKIRWEHDKYQSELIDPIIEILSGHRLKYDYIRYGHYTHTVLKDKLSAAKAVLFLCEHETQGLAYQQILSTGTPILAWDRAAYWQDPNYYPHKVKYQPVSSVPYWDNRCGMKFKGIIDFDQQLNKFLEQLGAFQPRAYILENLTLERCAQKYLDIHHQVESELNTL